MRFSTRSKLGIILALATILTLVSGFMVMAVANRGSGAHAASNTGVSYHTASGSLASQPVQLGVQDPAHTVSQTAYAPPSHFGKSAVNATAAQSAPAADSLSVQNGPAVLHNFDALSGKDNAKSPLATLALSFSKGRSSKASATPSRFWLSAPAQGHRDQAPS